MALARRCSVPKHPQFEDEVVRSLRVSRKLWTAAMARADERGESLSEAIRRFLERYSK